MARMSRSWQNVVSSPSNPATVTLGNSAHTFSSIAIRSSAVNRRARDLDLFTPTATTTSSKSSEALEMMSMWPLVTGSKEPGHTALRTVSLLVVGLVVGVVIGRSSPGSRVVSRVVSCILAQTGAKVPEHRLAVLLRPVAHEALGPRGFHATGGALDDQHGAWGDPAVVEEESEALLEVGVVQGVRRVGEHHVVRRPRVLSEH